LSNLGLATRGIAETCRTLAGLEQAPSQSATRGARS
jgi:hypothetical protein